MSGSSRGLPEASIRLPRLSAREVLLSGCSEPSSGYAKVFSIPRILERFKRGKRFPLRRTTSASPTFSILSFTCAAGMRSSSSRLTWGTAYFSLPTEIIWLGMIARVRGSLICMTVPLPVVESISIMPPNFSRLVTTTSIPTPLPETSVTVSAVEKPGSRISSIFSLADISAICCSLFSPFLTAAWEIFSGSRPLPSSEITIFTWPASWNALSVMLPVMGFPVFFL